MTSVDDKDVDKSFENEQSTVTIPLREYDKLKEKQHFKEDFRGRHCFTRSLPCRAGSVDIYIQPFLVCICFDTFHRDSICKY